MSMLKPDINDFPRVSFFDRFFSEDQFYDNAGIYIHIPFCLKKCPYCSFYSITDLSFKDNFLKALLKEMEYYRGSRMSFDSIYFGGGTPSVLSENEIFQILNNVHKFFNIKKNTEITLEVNPGTAGYKIFCLYRNTGINRLNIGVQSFDDNTLEYLGRIHSSRDACSAIRAARNAGFSNIGIDLIYGLSGQNITRWKQDLEKALSYFPEHLSCYMLSIEKGTPFHQAKEAGDILPADDSIGGNLFSFTWEFLSAHGYKPYEISNFSRNNPANPDIYRSGHNQKYWHFAPYLGFGPAAHSYLEPMRFWNKSSVHHYIRSIESGQHPMENLEILEREQQMIESVFLGLRTTEGIDVHKFNKKFNTDFFNLFSGPINCLRQRGYLSLSDNRCILTPSGMRFHDSICDLMVTEIP